MGKKRSFTKLKKEYSYEGFINFCKDTAKRYANSAPEFARTYFCELLNISPSCFYRVLEHAIVTNLVTEKEYEKMYQKSYKNQRSHTEDNSGGTTTYLRYMDMYKRRCQYIAYGIDSKTVREFVLQYIDNNLSKPELVKKYDISDSTANLLLIRSIEEGIITDEEVNKLEKRCLKNNVSKETVRDCFKVYRSKRKEFLEGLNQNN